ncbi:Tyrosine recombinase XerC [Burkholderia sp. AD24]|nr:Tyrosine recombinase XerC [Burkholderia sp. AD24]
MRLVHQPVELHRDIDDSGTSFWVLSDDRARVIMPFLDYIIHCVDVLSLTPKTVEGRAYSLKKWYQFLVSKRKKALDATDDDIHDFRDKSVKRKAANSSGDMRARRRTINLDLRNIYAYYAWLQSHSDYGKGRKLLGPRECQITSSLSMPTDRSVRRSDRLKHPLVFRNAGEHSKHRLSFVPKETHRAALTEYFYETQASNIAKRNCLIFETAWIAGWRRGSILSLQVDQFSRECIQQAAESIDVRPPVQKFGYSNTFPVDLGLANRIADYIEHERAEIMERTGSESNLIFLNNRTGKPLSETTVSCLFVAARNALGWPAGAALHSWRRGFTNAFIEREMDARLELGLDTSGETIAMSVAVALGQVSLSSQSAYIRDTQRRTRGTSSFRDKLEHARLADENAALRAEIARLRQLLD